ncbi:MAG TPA: beta-ketoacyl-[acyl-carrier-protein] synthase family protein [Caulobacteraceae bacterium]|jgi:nodulation protein E|nr:beta-ketoacyl-[acyl-carrier-protein] synthase family protein [Caulobacteraceae bacterium]
MSVRVAVTGLGCVSALGQGVQANWSRLKDGETGIRRLSQPHPDQPRLIKDGPAAVIDGVDTSAADAYAGRKATAQLDPVAVYAVVATHEALADAGLIGDPASLAAANIVYGGASGGNTTMEDGYVRILLKGQSSVHPLTIPKTMSSAAVSQLSMIFGIKGVAFAISSACSSSAHAISEAAYMIRAGRAKVAVAGGADSSLNFGSWYSWLALQAMATDTCRPFSIDRKGMVLGEGAATVVLEDMDHAKARGATIYAEIIGAGGSSDAGHLTAPSVEGAGGAVRAAYAEAGLAADTPVIVSAHGTGTPLNDKTETEVMRAVLGGDLARHRVIATKSAHGHLLGAGGAIEFLLGVLALREGVAPPILGYLGPDPECDLPLALGETKPFEAEALVSNSFAFGGLNSVLIARRA